MCGCGDNGHFAMPLGPAGMCLWCGVKGPFHDAAVAAKIASAGRHPYQDSSLSGNSRQDDDVVSRYQKIDWETAFKEEPDDVQWLRPDFLEKASLCGLFSRPGVGKSLLALDISLEIVRNGGSVTYIDHENRIADIIARLRAFGASWQELDRLAVYSFQSLPPLDTDRGGEHLEALAVADGPDLVILDTLSRMIMGDENDASSFLNLYRCTLVRLKKMGVAVLRLDHAGKDTTKGQRGSSAKESDLDCLWFLDRDNENTFTLECRKSRSGNVPFGTMIRLSRLYEPLRHLWSTEISMFPERYSAVVRQMDNLGIATSLGREAARAILADNGIGVRYDQLHAAILARRNREQAARAVPGPGLAPGECPF